MRKIAVVPQHFQPDGEEVLEIAHSSEAVKQKADKVREISMGDAIVEPYAMMIHFRNTCFTCSTVMPSVWLDLITFAAEADLLLWSRPGPSLNARCC